MRSRTRAAVLVLVGGLSVIVISRAQGAEPWEIGWLSGDGSTFTPMEGEDGKPLLGSAPVLQP